MKDIVHPLLIGVFGVLLDGWVRLSDMMDNWY